MWYCVRKLVYLPRFLVVRGGQRDQDRGTSRNHSGIQLSRIESRSKPKTGRGPPFGGRLCADRYATVLEGSSPALQGQLGRSQSSVAFTTR
jgi:hypothetical protein